jgi:hypothetical protein
LQYPWARLVSFAVMDESWDALLPIARSLENVQLRFLAYIRA